MLSLRKAPGSDKIVSVDYAMFDPKASLQPLKWNQILNLCQFYHLQFKMWYFILKRDSAISKFFIFSNDQQAYLLLFENMKSVLCNKLYIEGLKRGPKLIRSVSKINFCDLKSIEIHHVNLMTLEFITWMELPQIQRIRIISCFIFNVTALKKTNFKNLIYIQIEQKIIKQLDTLSRMRLSANYPMSCPIIVNIEVPREIYFPFVIHDLESVIPDQKQHPPIDYSFYFKLQLKKIQYKKQKCNPFQFYFYYHQKQIDRFPEKCLWSIEFKSAVWRIKTLFYHLKRILRKADNKKRNKNKILEKLTK